MKTWIKPTLVNLSNNKIQTGTAAGVFEGYINNNSACGWPCATAAGGNAASGPLSVFVTTSVYVAAASGTFAACSPGGGACS